MSTRNGKNGNNSQMRNNNFLCNITPFDGDADLVNFFFGQIEELQNINNWDNIQTLAFAKSKLTSNALKFYINSQNAQNATNLSELKIVFQNFFQTTPRELSMLNLTQLKLLPAESITNLAHRLETLVSKVHPQVTDNAALSSIKFQHFINSIPHQYKIKILEQGIQNYEAAVAKAQLLQNLEVHSQIIIPSTSSQPTLAEISAQVNSLKADFSSFDNQTKGYENKHKSYGNHRNNRNWNQNKPYKRFSYFQNNSVSKNKNATMSCGYCGRTSHVMKDCFQFKSEMGNLARNNNNNNQFQRSRTYYNPRARNASNRGRRQLNAYAPSYFPSHDNSSQNFPSSHNSQNLN